MLFGGSLVNRSQGEKQQRGVDEERCAGASVVVVVV
jgi:hypothetical protein